MNRLFRPLRNQSRSRLGCSSWPLRLHFADSADSTGSALRPLPPVCESAGPLLFSAAFSCSSASSASSAAPPARARRAMKRQRPNRSSPAHHHHHQQQQQQQQHFLRDGHESSSVSRGRGRGAASRHSFHGAVLPPGLFSSRVTALRAYPFNRTKNCTARFFLFEQKAGGAAVDENEKENGKERAQQQQKNRRRPPVRPVASMLNFVQVLTAPTADTPGTCLLVHYDNRRYIFGNVAEGTQRMFVQQKVSLSRAEEVFLTGPIGWQTAGGLLGLVLTVAEVVASSQAASAADDAQKAYQKAKQAQQAAAKREKKKKSEKSEKSGNDKAAASAAAPAAPLPAPAILPAPAAAAAEVRSLGIHGGINLTHLLATSRRFVFRKGMPIRPHEIREDPAGDDDGDVDGDSDAVREPDWVDDNMMVWYVPVVASGSEADQPSSSTLKRSHDAVEDDSEDNNNNNNNNNSSSSIEGRTLVESVVKNMFDSDWQLDALVETTLHAAKMPAKLFVRDAQGHLQAYKGPLPGDADAGAEPVPDMPVLVRQPWPAALIQGLPQTSPSRQSMCYVVRNHARRGKVDAAAAARLGVAKRDIRLLVEGQSVTVVSAAADGTTSRTVTPDMVVGPAVEGAAFAVVDLPDRSFVDAFVARPEWKTAKSGKDEKDEKDEKDGKTGGLMGPVNTMFWILGPGLAADPRLLAFMRRFPAVRHVVAAPDACPNRITLGAAAALQAKHHRVDPDRFPLPQFDNSTPMTTTTTTTTAAAAAAKPDEGKRLPYETARAGWAVRLAPQVVEEDAKVFPDVDFAAALGEMDPAVVKLADRARTQVAAAAAAAAQSSSPDDDDLPHPDAEVISLGTGSAMPSKYRNVSATLVRVPGVGSYLFDCGENTLGSMRRMLGEAGLASALRDLRGIWISHLHADHHLGTASVVRAFMEATKGAADETAEARPRLLVASHVNMLHWLREYADVEDLSLGRLRLVELDSSARHERVCPPVIFSAAEAAEFGLQRIDACRVEHCHGALATVFTWAAAASADKAGRREPFRVAYSGDCRPSSDFARIGRGATLLIHESTFDDELAGEALAKKHSTMGEALRVARRMGARRVLLTHFSQRYPKIPLFGEEDDDGGGDDDHDHDHDHGRSGRKRDMPVLVAFDHMRVRLGDFHAAAAFLPALQKLYEGEEKS